MVRDALVRFALRRAARARAPRRADFWLRLACAWSPTFGEAFAALVELRRAREDRLGAMSAAQAATRRFPPRPPARMLPGGADPAPFPLKEGPAAPQPGRGPREPGGARAAAAGAL